MNYIINFFESLELTDVYCNIEFESNYEIITVNKNNNHYLFKFHKSSPIFRTNLCKEILLITEDDADLKININHPLSLYFDKKKEKQSIEFLQDISISLYEQDFLQQFENKIQSYSNFQKIYSHCKMEIRFPEKKIHIKKTKI